MSNNEKVLLLGLEYNHFLKINNIIIGVFNGKEKNVRKITEKNAVFYMHKKNPV